LKPYKVIRDPIHGDIGLSRLELELLDTPQMQRLRRVKQNGLCYLVYPAMNSTRFEHSLGVMHLAGVLADHLDLDEKEKKLVKVAGLLHDIGHTPLSHTTEEVLRQHGLDHEKISREIIQDGKVREILENHSINPGRIGELIKGEGRLGSIISSQIDVDKMDYLVRDAYYAGVAYGVTDIERVINSTGLSKDGIYVKEGGLEAVESLLVNRNLMYQTVYRHHTKRIAEAMFTHALQKMMEDRLGYDRLARLDDIQLVSMMRNQNGYVKDMIKRIDDRRLHKNMFQEKIIELDEDFRMNLEENPLEFEEEIRKDLDLDYGNIIVDYPEIKMSEFKVQVEDGKKYKPIDEVSPLAESLEKNESEKLLFNIYADPQNMDSLEDFNPHQYVKYRQTRIDSYI